MARKKQQPTRVTRHELIAGVAALRINGAPVSKKEAKQVVSFLFNVMTVALESGGEVSIPGFGVFRVRDTAARTSRSPKTGEEVEVPAKRNVRFKAYTGLKQRLNPDLVLKASKAISSDEEDELEDQVDGEEEENEDDDEA